MLSCIEQLCQKLLEVRQVSAVQLNILVTPSLSPQRLRRMLAQLVQQMPMCHLHNIIFCALPRDAVCQIGSGEKSSMPGKTAAKTILPFHLQNTSAHTTIIQLVSSK